ncbi:MAG TPA: immunoglobulin domain-containing protein, partial [Candidatus Hydrogenedentes bacterium]|nr:immunoglobulin domain-containing protein [Candidatus Hydrogenedentota bacterium]
RDGVALTDNATYSGVNTPTLTISNCHNSEEGSYTCRVYDGGLGSTLLGTGTLIVSDPAFLTNPQSQTVDPLTDVTFSVTAAGTVNTIRWLMNGAPISNGTLPHGTIVSGADTLTLTLTGARENDEGNYVCELTGPDGTVLSTAAILTVNNPPVISVHPLSVNIPVGGSTVLSVQLSSGTPNFDYVWVKEFSGGGEELLWVISKSSTSDSMNIPLSGGGAQLSDTGRYRVKIKNSASTAMNQTGDPANDWVVSNWATVTVYEPLTVITQPSSQSANYGDTVTFTCTVGGSLTGLQFEWLDASNQVVTSVNPRASVNNAGPTSTLTITNVQNTDEPAGWPSQGYRCRISNAYQSGGNAIYTQRVNLTVQDPAIITHPANQTANLGGTATFSVVAVGSANSYAWYKEGSGTVLGTNATLTLTGISESDAGLYYCTVTGPDGSVESNRATLSISDPYIVGHPTSVTADPGDTVNFSVVIGSLSTKPIGYQWRKDGVNLTVPGASGTLDVSNPSWTVTLTLAGISQSDEGSYDCVLNGVSGQVFSNAATLTIRRPPTVSGIQVNPSTGIAPLGSNASLKVIVTGGTPPFTYQWTKNGLPITDPNISGLNTDTLIFTGVIQNNEGTYRCVVSNSAGSAQAERLFIAGSLVTFAVQPQSKKAYYGENTSFSVVVTGGKGTKTYRWKKNRSGVITVVGSNSTTLSLTDLRSTDAASYWCEVTDERGVYSSNIATLALADHLQITESLPSATTVPSRGTTTLTLRYSGGHSPVTVMWQRDGQPLKTVTGQLIPNGSQLVFTNPSESESGTYTAVVFDAHTDLISQSCNVTVVSNLPALNLLGLALAVLAFSIAGFAYVRYRSVRVR